MSREGAVALALALLAALGLAYLNRDQLLAAVGGVMDQATWARRTWSAIRSALPTLSTSAQLIVMAHATYESGWGKAHAAVRGNNLFNLTAGSAWTGAKWTDVGGDTEYAANGAVKRIDQVWRAYRSIEEGVADYWAFLGPGQNRGRYVLARGALERGDLEAFAQELYRAGYYTLPPDKYVAQLGAVFTSVQKALGVLS